jgi:hypothetical protein
MRHASSSVCLVIALCFICVLCVSSARAEWPSGSSPNLPIADRASEQVTPLIATTSDGGCYVAWFDLASGSYCVYLQRLDVSGNELWPHNGMLVSNHAQSTSLVAWDMTVDHLDNAIVVFSDTRAGSDLDNYAYKVSPDGEMLWGPDGVTLSTNNDFEPGASVIEATDGDLVFVWARMPDVGDGDIRMQRLSPDGVERFAHGGIAIAGAASESPAFPDVIVSLDGSVIVSWVRDIDTYTAPRHLRARRFDSTGAPVWATYVNIFEAAALPMGYDPEVQSDGAGGLVCAVHASVSNMFTSRYQHLTANGLELMPHNGAIASTLSTQHHIDPTLAYDRETGDAYVFWNERNSAQSQWGIYAQRFADDGTRMWGNSGLVLLPVNTTYKCYPRAVPCTGGAMAFFTMEPAGTNDRLVGLRVDATGASIWPGGLVEISAPNGAKARYPVVINGAEMAVLVWEDNRSGAVDLYGQNVNADGTLGVSAGSVAPHALDALPYLTAGPNPFRGETRFAVGATEGLRDARILIFDPAGRLVRALPAGDAAARASGIPWDGTDGRGARLPAGAYLYRLAGGGARAAGCAILLD